MPLFAGDKEDRAGDPVGDPLAGEGAEESGLRPSRKISIAFMFR